jgi:hypothetical protein
VTAGRVLVASILVAHKLDEGYALKWLDHAEAMRTTHPPGVDWFLAVEVDGRGLDPFKGVLTRLDELGGGVWSYQIDKAPRSGEPWEVTSRDRFIRIATGRNLAIEYALNGGHTHILWLDSDTEPTPDCIPKLLEVARPLVYGHVPSYCLDGPRVDGLPGDSRRHWSSAGFCMASREVFRRVRWAWDPDVDSTDDPTFARDVELMGWALGEDWAPITRHDVVGRHWPEMIWPLEQRPVDRRLYR